jgi:hypothetical protein
MAAVQPSQPHFFGRWCRAFACLALAPVMASDGFRKQHAATMSKQGIGLLLVGAFFAVNIGFNNVSLLTISLSVNQVIRCAAGSCPAPSPPGPSRSAGLAARVQRGLPAPSWDLSTPGGSPQRGPRPPCAAGLQSQL